MLQCRKTGAGGVGKALERTGAARSRGPHELEGAGVGSYHEEDEPVAQLVEQRTSQRSARAERPEVEPPRMLGPPESRRYDPAGA